MNKENARTFLARTCDNFFKFTGEVVALTFSWKGMLTVYGPDAFKQLIKDHTDEVWESLSLPDHANKGEKTKKSQKQSRPLVDDLMNTMLKGDVKQHTRSTLRKLVSWATQRSIGMLLSDLFSLHNN